MVSCKNDKPRDDLPPSPTAVCEVLSSRCMNRPPLTLAVAK